MDPYPSTSSNEDIVAYTTSSIWSEFEEDFSQTYSQDWSPTHDFDHCPCCYPRPIDDLIAEAQEVSQFPSRCYTTSDYSDFRASTRAQQRKRKIRENNGGCNSYRCRKMEQAQQDVRNLKRKREALKWAIRESQIKTPCLAANSGRRTRHCFVTWDMSVEEELDDSKRQTETTTYDHAETLAKEAPSIDLDENLVEWCMVPSADATAVSEMNLHHRETDSTGLVVSEQGESQKRLWQIFAQLYTCNAKRERTLMTHKVARKDARICEGEQDVVSTRCETQDEWDLVSIASIEV